MYNYVKIMLIKLRNSAIDEHSTVAPSLCYYTQVCLTVTFCKKMKSGHSKIGNLVRVTITGLGPFKYFDHFKLIT